MPRIRPLASRTLVTVALLLGTWAGVSGCAPSDRCAPPSTTLGIPEGAAAASASQEGDAPTIDGVTVTFLSAGCADGPWRATLALVFADGVNEEVTVEVGETVALGDGRTLVVLAGSPDGNWVDVAISPAG